MLNLERMLVIVSTLGCKGVVILEHSILLRKISANFSKALIFSSPNCSIGEEGAGFFRVYSKLFAVEMTASYDDVNSTFTYFGKNSTASAIRSLPVVGIQQPKLR